MLAGRLISVISTLLTGDDHCILFRRRTIGVGIRDRVGGVAGPGSSLRPLLCREPPRHDGACCSARWPCCSSARGIERRRWPLVVAGTGVLMVAFFFKQTVAIFAVVPLIALLLRMRRPARSELIPAAIPLVALGVVILCLRPFNPAIHHYMIAVPRDVLDQLGAGRQVFSGRCCSIRRSFWCCSRS